MSVNATQYFAGVWAKIAVANNKVIMLKMMVLFMFKVIGFKFQSIKANSQ